tara:strand:+ start:1288 stop:2496 length:1209 start_codon:yes stop_codon:yes gene_type:complete
MNLSLLLLTKEKIPNNRLVINDLWCKILPESGIKLFWIAESQTNKDITIKKFHNLVIIIYPTFPNNFFYFFKSFLLKLRITNLLVKKNLINHVQVRNGISDGLISLIVKLKYSVSYSFHLSSLHGFEDDFILDQNQGLSKIRSLLKMKLSQIFYCFIMYNAKTVQPISSFMAKYLVEKIKINKEKIFPLPVSSNKKRIDLTKIKSLSKNPIVIYVGAISKERDIKFILKVFKQVYDKNSLAHFRIVGLFNKKTDFAYVKSLAEDFDLVSRIDFFTNISYENTIKLVEESDIGISAIPPLKKFLVSTPSKVIDYLSCGLPVVCNNEIYDQEYVISHSNGGFSVPYSVKHFTNAIVSILKDNQLYSEMSKEGKQWIFDNRTYDDLSVNLIRKYKILGKIQKDYC